ncbi:Hsp33 family molecular chaperone HslO [Porticoccaceae bacterium]|nr:Hsp33 family molecular chaperone HslO [Porticoccaceae bacterium]MDA8663780.1 Hsp33 family molecular chaperone HslO [Porticoccaceae bacterium]MDA8681752.1 Hsp33 family molecular chaperone HslO [Porticoccaceae bacterium]MDB2344110.1 Hsp33 family molecular chaperone HslO [Porticoccaceae bacterium]MDB2634822.1 Hsp33 family molecular chaperone HslO [Porticoccaceae bacterium]
MSNKDTLQSFLFDGTDVRGEINTLTGSYQEIMALQQYPQTYQRRVGSC